MVSLDTIGLFILLAGFSIGLGAVTVIDVCGFLGRQSRYWTEATTRVHKVTKPLIWIGMLLLIIGGSVWYRNEALDDLLLIQIALASALIVNGMFLSFLVSPFLLRREQQGQSAELLPRSWQYKIAGAFIVSWLGWWGSLGIVVWKITHN